MYKYAKLDASLSAVGARQVFCSRIVRHSGTKRRFQLPSCRPAGPTRSSNNRHETLSSRRNKSAKEPSRTNITKQHPSTRETIPPQELVLRLLSRTSTIALLLLLHHSRTRLPSQSLVLTARTRITTTLCFIPK
jgi:hypothetical protein